MRQVGGRVIKGCTDMKQEMLGIRKVRKNEERSLEPEIVMSKSIESAGRKRIVVWQDNMRTVLVKVRQNEQV